MFKFILGVLAASLVITIVLAFGPSGTERKVRSAGQVVMERATDVQFDICKKNYLSETNCFQDKKLTAADCEKQVISHCK